MTEKNYKKILNPDSEQVAGVVDKLYAFGLTQVGGEEPARIAFICESGDGRFIGGIVGYSLLNRFYLSQLWVGDEYRRQGVGAELAGRMEAVARERECADIVVDTLNAGAVPFYERLGYTVSMVNPGYVRGFDWYFLRKQFRPVARGRE